ncbi:MAG: winged helix-turn-helix transcriptional regulator [Nitrososphaerota archaeon]|nr:winged helix-turn-helix transcriptional regulator [Nitrososphaerota archaeon]MDG6978910.1 winged helix-turn-helix transcriptional regulator [Nitrososphaerota archaeon]
MQVPPERKDEQILAMLYCNSRASLREIGREVDLCASAVRARINRLVESGEVLRFTTRVNPAAFGFQELVFFSYQDSQVSEETRRMLRAVGKPIAQGETIVGYTCVLKAVTMADGPMLSRLAGQSDMVRATEMGVRWNPDSRLSTTDLLIIRCLLSNPRASVDAIAEHASVSSKTVSHRLEGLLSDHVLAFRVDVDASKAGLVEGLLLIRLGEGAPKATFGSIDETLRKGMLCASHIRFDRDLVATYCCAGTVFDMGPSLKRIRLLDGVVDVTAHVFSQLSFGHEWVFEQIGARLSSGMKRPGRPMIQPILSAID